jgi:adenylate cyclase
MWKREAEIAPMLAEKGGGAMYTRIGINSGAMSVGNMGSTRKLNYSVLGDSVNLGSRLEAANKMYGTRIMVSQATADLARDHFTFRRLDALRVKGKLLPVNVFELLAEGPPTPALARLIQRYEAALASYQSQEWDDAERHLLEIKDEFGQDGPSITLSGRIRLYRHDPPPADWDGVFVATEK